MVRKKDNWSRQGSSMRRWCGTSQMRRWAIPLVSCAVGAACHISGLKWKGKEMGTKLDISLRQSTRSVPSSSCWSATPNGCERARFNRRRKPLHARRALERMSSRSASSDQHVRTGLICVLWGHRNVTGSRAIAVSHLRTRCDEHLAAVCGTRRAGHRGGVWNVYEERCPPSTF